MAGASDIVNPGVAWKYYVGGALQNAGYWAGDIDGSGQPSVVYAAAGKVLAKRPDDTIVWQSSQVYVQSIIDVWDVDGDGILDVVAMGAPSTVVILSGRDGSVEWSMPISAGIGSIALARTVDLNGDGKRDLYVADCGCCGPSANGAVAYSFAGGFAATTGPLWTIPVIADGTCHSLDLITDLNGDGVADVVRLYSSTMMAFSGLTGALEFQWAGNTGDVFPNFGGLVAASTTSSSVIFFENFYDDSIPAGGKRVAAYGYDAASNAIVEQWNIQAGSQPLSDQVAFDSNSLGSFDGSGTSEVAFSLYDSAARLWTLEVVDAVSGTVIALVPGAIYQGTADVDGDGIAELLATSGGLLTSFKLGAGTLRPLGSFSGVVTRQIDRALTQRQATASPVVTTSLSDGGQDVIVTAAAGVATYEAVDLSAGPGTVLAAYTAPSAVAFQGTNVFVDPATQLPQPYLVLSSGYLAVLDPRTFQPTNIDSSSDFPQSGMRTGGYVSPATVVGKLGERGAPAVITQVSEVGLVRLDPGRSTTPATRLNPTWEISGLQAPSLVDFAGNGRPAVVAADGGEIVAFEATGQTQLWATPQGIIGDLPFGDANGDGVPDIFYEDANPLDGWILNVNVLDGRSGLPLWSAPYSTPVAWGTGNLSVGDLTGNGRSDVVSVVNNVTYLSGSSGVATATASVFTAYGSALIADVMDAGTPQVYLNGSYFAPQLDGTGAGTVWTQGGGVDAHWTAAALAPCGTGSLFVEASGSMLHAFDAQTGVEVWREVLASGQSFASVAAVPASTLVGVLGNTTVKEDLTGTNHMDALVGSSDGYLYAVQACNGGAIDWAYDFGYPVGEPIVADSRGTGKDQVLVPVADGYLYALDQFAISCPSYANATATNATARRPWGGRGASGSSLSVEWAAVPGATSYDWAVYTSAGVAVTSFQSGGYTIRTQATGDVVDLDATGIPLVAGGRYYFAIRAAGPNGVSGEVISNTVSVTEASAPIAERPILPIFELPLRQLFR